MSRARAERWVVGAVPRMLALLGCASLMCAGAMGCTSSQNKLRYPVGISGGPVEEASTRSTPARAPATPAQAEAKSPAAGDDDGEHQPVRGFEIPFRSVRRGAAVPATDYSGPADHGDDSSDSGLSSDSVPTAAGPSGDD